MGNLWEKTPFMKCIWVELEPDQIIPVWMEESYYIIFPRTTDFSADITECLGDTAPTPWDKMAGEAPGPLSSARYWGPTSPWSCAASWLSAESSVCGWHFVGLCF